MEHDENGLPVPENRENPLIETTQVQEPPMALAQAAQSMLEASSHYRSDSNLDDMVGALCSTLVYEGVDDPANLDMRLTAQAMVLDTVFNYLVTKSVNHEYSAVDDDRLRLALRAQKRYQDTLQSLRQKKYRKCKKNNRLDGKNG